MEKIIKIYNSFSEQEEDDVQYWTNLSGEKKIEYLEIIRTQYWYLINDNPPGFQRVSRIIKRA